jgi:flagellar basal-body rod protein FlgF
MGEQEDGAMMENSMLIGLSRQTALRRQMDVIANNLANLGTAGFRGQTMLFAEHLTGRDETSGLLGQGALSYVVDRGSLHDFSTGPLTSTGNPLDMALDGDGWFVVETPEGERYTRNGAFKLDAEGALVTSEGHRVLGDGGQIVFDPEETEITVAADGTVSTNIGEKAGLRIVAFDDNGVLRSEGASLFAADVAPADAEGVRVVQGAVEGSNVRPILEMSRMIEVQRNYATLAQMMERSDELRRQAITTLGRVE